jgi:hypothetical protein
MSFLVNLAKRKKTPEQVSGESFLRLEMERNFTASGTSWTVGQVSDRMHP